MTLEAGKSKTEQPTTNMHHLAVSFHCGRAKGGQEKEQEGTELAYERKREREMEMQLPGLVQGRCLECHLGLPHACQVLVCLLLLSSAIV